MTPQGIAKVFQELHQWQQDLLNHILTSDDMSSNQVCGVQYDRITRILSHEKHQAPPTIGASII